MINLDEIRARCERYRTREIDHVYIETYLADVEGLLAEIEQLKARFRPVCPSCGLENIATINKTHCDRCDALLSGRVADVKKTMEA